MKLIFYPCFINHLVRRKIIETLEKEEKGLILKMHAEKPSNILEYDAEWRKHFNDLLKTYEKYLFLIKQKKDTIIKLDRRIKNLQNETKIQIYYGDTKTTQMNENIEKANKQLHLLQNKLHNVSFVKITDFFFRKNYLRSVMYRKQ